MMKYPEGQPQFPIGEAGRQHDLGRTFAGYNDCLSTLSPGPPSAFPDRSASQPGTIMKDRATQAFDAAADYGSVQP